MVLSAGMKTFLADFSLMLVALFWGLGFVAMKDALESYPTFWLLVLRFGSGAALMAALFRKRLAGVSPADVRAGVIIGVFFFWVFHPDPRPELHDAWQAGLSHRHLCGHRSLLSWVFRKRFPGLLSFAASAVCLAGMAMLTLQEGLAVGAGDTLTLVCAVFFACHILAIEYFAAKPTP